MPIPSPKLLNLSKEHSPKNCFVWSNPHNTEVMVTFLIEMLELPNLVIMIKSTI